MKKLILELFELGAVKFGSFTLKSGILSPIYIDLRITISRPKLLVSIGDQLLNQANCKPDLVCGVPYTALPFATAISIQHSLPMLLCRKEVKDYGTKKRIEGIFQLKQNCLLIEDVITSGQSIFETIGPLQQEGLTVTDIAVLVDREQGGKKFIESKGFKVHAVCTITSIVETLTAEKKISNEMKDAVLNFIKGAQVHV